MSEPLSKCPGCGSTWSCGAGCPIWGYGGSGWGRPASEELKARRIAMVNDDPQKGESE